MNFVHPRKLVWFTARDLFSSNQKTYLSWEVHNDKIFTTAFLIKGWTSAKEIDHANLNVKFKDLNMIG